MSEDLHHECGIAALYWLDEAYCRGGKASKAVLKGDVTRPMPGMLLDLQNRGQLAAGLSSFNAKRPQKLDTYKDIGTVAEAFRMSHPDKHRSILDAYAGQAVIGHTRYATCGLDDVRYAQPFERRHGRLWKWFAFGFNGNLANYARLRDRLLAKRNYHFTLDTDTEIIMHVLSYRLRGDRKPDLVKVMASLSRDFDGAYNIVFIDALGRMFVARDPLGLRPLSVGAEGRLFAAASESVALSKLGFEKIQSLEPGQMALIEDGRLRFERFAPSPKTARCFFEWVYFSNVASEIDGASVYLARARSGQLLAGMEDQPLDETCVVVPVPDTAKAAGDAFAYRLGMPSVEGLIRNRYVGRTFIQPDTTRRASASSKYTPIPPVLRGKRVFLLEDSIVRSTTLKALVEELRTKGRAKEVHVRVACPPIISPCFYGIDMSTLGELFAPRFVEGGYKGAPSSDMLKRMAAALKVDSLRYLPVKDLSPCLDVDDCTLCTGCVTGKYPSRAGNELRKRAVADLAAGKTKRTYE